MGCDKKLIVHIIRDFIREEYKDYIEKSTAKEADWVIYLDHEDELINLKISEITNSLEILKINYIFLLNL